MAAVIWYIRLPCPWRSFDPVFGAGVQVFKHLHLHHIKGFGRHLHGTGLPAIEGDGHCASVNWLLLLTLPSNALSESTVAWVLYHVPNESLPRTR